MRPADIRWTRSTSSPSAVWKRSRLPRRSAPASRRPSSAESGGSKVFRVAMWAGPARATGQAATGPSSSRRHASISGSSGIPVTVPRDRWQPPLRLRHAPVAALQLAAAGSRVAAQRPVAATITNRSRLLNRTAKRSARVELMAEAPENGSVVDEGALLPQAERAAEAAPLPRARAGAKAGLHGVVHRIRVCLEEVAGVVDPARAVAASLYVATPPVAAIEHACVAVVERLHRRGKDSVADLDDQVVVGAHQAEAYAPPLARSGNAGQSTQEFQAIEIVAVIGIGGPDAMRPDMEHPCGDVASLVCQRR